MHFTSPTNLARLALGTSLLLTTCTQTFGQIIDGAKYNNPDSGPPASFFSAAATMPIAALQTAAAGLSSSPKDGTYRISSGSRRKAIIRSEWAGFDEGAAFVWTADMDVDCDGVDWKCKGNPDGQPQTNWGTLSAYEVPFVVIPDKSLMANQEDALPGNNVAAVICNGNMFYGILGDSDGDNPQVIGEASWLMARTCFPDEGLAGDVGHAEADVTYIVFTGPNAVLPPNAVGETYLTDFTTLRDMGDDLANKLVKNVGVGTSDSAGGARRKGVSPNDSEDVESAATTTRNTPISKTLLGTAVAGTTLLTSTLGGLGSSATETESPAEISVLSVCGGGDCSQRQEEVPVNMEEEASLASSMNISGVLGAVVAILVLTVLLL